MRLSILTAVFAAATSVVLAQSAAAPVAKPDAQSNSNVAGAAQPNAPAATPEAAPAAPAASASTNQPTAPVDKAAVLPAQTTETAASTPTAKVAVENGTNVLRMNFRGASLEQVLNYFSEAAGFIINLKPGTSVRGKVDLWSNEPLTREEALDLLDTVLVQNGLAAIRNGKVLTIVARDEAKTQNIPVIQGSDPETMPVSDRVVTQIIPVRYVEVAQLVKDLQPLVSMQTSITANEAGNALVITDTQANIRKVAEVVKAIDMGAEDVTVVKVFHLQHADPTETADLLTNLFPDDTRTGGNQSPMQFGGPGGFIRRMMTGGGPGGTGATGGSNSQSSRIRKRNRVVAVADPRTGSVVVTATKVLMDQIEDVITQLDPDPANTRGVAIFPVQNAEPQEALQVLQDMFNKTGTPQNNRSTSSQNNPLLNRSTTQNQQTTSGSRSTSMTPGSRGGGIGTFGQ